MLQRSLHYPADRSRSFRTLEHIHRNFDEWLFRGEPIPRLEYQPEEKECWRTVLRELKQLYATHACQEFLDNFSVYDFSEEEIPQLEDVSNILR
jgi:hypothetical protein